MISYNSKANLNRYTQIIHDLGNFLFDYELEIDSRKVSDTSIFCAYPGVSNDGRNYIESALAKGAKAILYEPGITVTSIPVKSIQIEYLMFYVGMLAAYKYHNPSEKFYTIGVTGTNGKTSVSHWINQLDTKLGGNPAIIGTTGAGLYRHIKDYAATTPDPITVQKLLSEFAHANADLLAMEVSSHSLHQGRVNGVVFKTAIFTNLSQDHLDYHKTMEDYYLAKRELFYWRNLEHAIINIDDIYGRRLVGEIDNDIAKYNYPLKVLTYGLNDGDLRASNLIISLTGMHFNLSYNNEQFQVQVPVIGRFNVYNILAVVASFIVRGYQLAVIVPLLSKLIPVCGRMDTIIRSNCPLVVIDYAHTPDALLNTLRTLKEIEHSGKLYCVFGCGGNRDTSKRPIMANVASSIADYTYITSDNPRDEDPEVIIEQIVTGVASVNYEVIVDRADAISMAIKKAKANDIVLIAGKGHETYQEIKGIKHHFSDFEVAQNVLKEKL